MLIKPKCNFQFFFNMRDTRIAFGIILLQVLGLGVCQVTTNMSLLNVTSSSKADSTASANSTLTPDSNPDFNSTFSRGSPDAMMNVTTSMTKGMTSSTNATKQLSTLNLSELSTPDLPTEAVSVKSTESQSSEKITATTQNDTNLMMKSSTLVTSSETGTVKTTVLTTKSSTRDVRIFTQSITSEKSKMTSHKMTKLATIKRTVTLPSVVSHTTMKASEDVTLTLPNASATIIVSIVIVVFFVAVVGIALICFCRRRNRKKPRTLMATNQPPTVHASHRQLDFENLNDASSPGEFLLDKTIIDLESPNNDSNPMQALALLDHATEEFESKEILTFKTNSQEQLGERNGEVPNKSERVDSSDLDSENSEPEENENSDEENKSKEGLDTKVEDPDNAPMGINLDAKNDEISNGEITEKETNLGSETKPEGFDPKTTELNSEPEDKGISIEEGSGNKPLTGSQTKSEDGAPVSEL